MASTYSSNLRIELITTGEQTGSWGATTNTNLGTLIEQAISGVVSVAISSGDNTLTALNGASDESRNAVIVLTGSVSGTTTVNCGLINKVYIVKNSAGGAVTFRANSSDSGVELASGSVQLLYCDGTNVFTAINNLPSGSTIGGETVVTTSASQTLTSKTLTAPVISTITNTGTLTLPTSTDTLVGRATTDTLTNKTLTSPVISTISNTGTLTLPTSTDTLVGRATTDTLTNKTLTAPVISTISNSGTLTLPTTTDTLVGRATTDTLTNKTLTAPAVTGTIVEDVYNLTGTALDPDNGSIQYKTLASNTTLTDSLSAGEAITLMIDDGSSYTVTWPTMTWVNNGGSAPTLATTGYTVVALWKVSSTLYGALVGDGS
jgi:hypothetical protein